MKKLIFLPALMLLISCAALLQNTDTRTDNQLQAENHLMQKNLDLALNQNEILQEENRQNKSEIQDMNDTIVQIKSDLHTCDEKYTQDMAMMSDQYKSLQVQYETYQNETNQRIEAAAETNRQLNETLEGERQTFKDTLQAQQEKHKEEMLAEQTKHNDLMIAQQKKYDGEIETLKASLLENKQTSEKQIADLTGQLQEKKLALSDMDKKLKSADSKIEQLQLALTENQSKIKALQEEILLVQQKSIQNSQVVSPPPQPQNAATVGQTAPSSVPALKKTSSDSRMAPQPKRKQKSKASPTIESGNETGQTVEAQPSTTVASDSRAMMDPTVKAQPEAMTSNDDGQPVESNTEEIKQ